MASEGQGEFTRKRVGQIDLFLNKTEAMFGLFRKIYVKWLCLIGKAIDIRYNGTGDAYWLSNFLPYDFTFRDVKILSMESLLQGIKFKNPFIQDTVFRMSGKEAKHTGKNSEWYRDQTLYWRGEPMKRDSEEYQSFLREAYDALFLNTHFLLALGRTRGKKLYHTIGKSNPAKTVLTESEFCGILTRLRDENRNLFKYLDEHTEDK